MAGGKPHGSNPRAAHQAHERHQVLEHAERLEGRRARHGMGEPPLSEEELMQAHGVDVIGPAGTQLSEGELIPLLRACAYDMPLSEVDLAVLAYRLAHSPLRFEREP